MLSSRKFSGAPSPFGCPSSSLVWGPCPLLIPPPLGRPVWGKRVRYPHPKGMCPFRTGSVGIVKLRGHCCPHRHTPPMVGVPDTAGHHRENIPGVKFLSLTSACEADSPGDGATSVSLGVSSQQRKRKPSCFLSQASCYWVGAESPPCLPPRPHPGQWDLSG